LGGEREIRLNERGIEDEGEQRPGVGEGEETPENGGSLLAGEPVLQQWAGRGEQEERQSDGKAERFEDGGEGMGGSGREIGLAEESESGAGEDEQDDVQDGGLAGIRAAGEPVGVEVSEEQGGLKEDEAGDPHSGGAAEGGQELFGGHGLDGEEEQGAKEDCAGIEDADGTGNGIHDERPRYHDWGWRMNGFSGGETIR